MKYSFSVLKLFTRCICAGSILVQGLVSSLTASTLVQILTEEKLKSLSEMQKNILICYGIYLFFLKVLFFYVVFKLIAAAFFKKGIRKRLTLIVNLSTVGLLLVHVITVYIL